MRYGGAMDKKPASSRIPRSSVMLTAHLFRAGQPGASQHRVVNMSEVGLCVGQAADLDPGSAVVVDIGQVEHVPADVVWVRNENAGLRFHDPIDLKAARLRRKGDSAPPTSGWLADLNSAYRR